MQPKPKACVHNDADLMMLEILDIPFVFFGIIHRIECAKIFAFMRVRIYFPGVDTVFARL
jgi:hypothetical protein